MTDPQIRIFDFIMTQYYDIEINIIVTKFLSDMNIKQTRLQTLSSFIFIESLRKLIGNVSCCKRLST